jgi:hypothetical protein
MGFRYNILTSRWRRMTGVNGFDVVADCRYSTGRSAAQLAVECPAIALFATGFSGGGMFGSHRFMRAE